MVAIMFVCIGTHMSTPDHIDFTALHDQFSQITIKNFNKDGQVYSNAMFIKLAEPVVGVAKPVRIEPMDSRQVHEFMSSQEGRDRFSMFLREVLTEGSPVRESVARSLGFAPDALVHVDEAWTAKPRTGEDPMSVVPSQRSDRQEVVMIAIHHRWGATVLGMHPIIQLPTRHAKFKKLDKAIAVVGRLAMTPDRPN